MTLTEGETNISSRNAGRRRNRTTHRPPDALSDTGRRLLVRPTFGQVLDSFNLVVNNRP